MMKSSRTFSDDEKSVIDETSPSSASLENLFQTLKTRGLFSFRNMSDTEQRRVWDWSKTIVRQYRKILERNIANIRSADELPLPKEDIKLAIKVSMTMYVQKSIHDMVGDLKTIYKELGNFQSIDAVDKEKLRKKFGRPRKITDVQYGDLLEIHEKYMEMVVSEKKSLLEEINHYIHRLESLR